MRELETSNPKAHSKNIRKEMQELSDHLRRDISKIDEPEARTLFETSAEVIDGLINAFDHFENENKGQ